MSVEALIPEISAFMIATQRAEEARDTCGTRDDVAVLERMVENARAAETIAFRRLIAEPFVSVVDLALGAQLLVLLVGAGRWPDVVAPLAAKLADGYLTLAAPAKASA